MAEEKGKSPVEQLAAQLRAQEVGKLIKQLTALQVLAEGRGLGDLAKQIQRHIRKEKHNLNALLSQTPRTVADAIRYG